jgi:hypothetical protein
MKQLSSDTLKRTLEQLHEQQMFERLGFTRVDPATIEAHADVRRYFDAHSQCAGTHDFKQNKQA